MADDTLQTGTDTISTDHVSTLNGATIVPAASTPKVQRVKVSYGDDNTSRDVSSSFPLPVLMPDFLATGTITVTDSVVAAPAGAGAFVTGASTAGSLVAIACPGGDSAWNLQITALTTGTLYFETSLDSTTGTDGNWIAVNGRQTGIVNTVLGFSAASNGMWRGNTSGARHFRVRAVGALTGTPAIRINISDGVGAVFLNASIPAGTNAIGNVGGAGVAGTPAGGVLSVQGVASGTAQPVSGTFFQATQPVSLATNTPDVTDRAGRLVGVATLGAGAAAVGTVGVTSLPATPAGANTIGNVGLVAGAAAIGTVAINAAIPAGANSIGTVAQAAITKGTQGATGVTTQDLKDAGRGLVTYYTLIPVLSTATDTLQSLTGTKGAATVAATTTPAVVTAAKTLRITRFWATYVATATSGYGMVRLRYNTAGVVVLASPVLGTMAIGSGTPATANSSASEEFAIPGGIEVPAGTGVGISVQGFAAVTATAVGYVLCGYSGYEY